MELADDIVDIARLQANKTTTSEPEPKHFLKVEQTSQEQKGSEGVPFFLDGARDLEIPVYLKDQGGYPEMDRAF